ncbi:TRAP transporter small permease [Chloroflexota bacterium]
MSENRLEKVPFRRLVYSANGTIAVIGGVGALILVALTSMEVVKRYFLNMPTEWVLEISEYFIILVAFTGMAYTMQVGAHVMVDIIYRHYPRLGKRVTELIVSTLSLVFWAFLVGTAVRQSLIYLARNTRSETLLAVPQIYPMLPIIIGSLLCCFQASVMIYDTVVALRDYNSGWGTGKVAMDHSHHQEVSE